MARLFEALTLRDVTVRNRIWLAPMCTYSVAATNGVPTDWHLVHLGARASGGFGVVMTEATAVVPEGRISARDCGIWNDEQVTAWRRITSFITGQGATPAIQLAHAGRKASTHPWLPGAGNGSLTAEEGGWETVGPADVAFPGLATPRGLSAEEIGGVVDAFAVAARRAVDAGFEVLELHAAHGYLLHEFLSPLSNARSDAWGGSLENRCRVVLDTVRAIRSTIPEGTPLVVRVSATDWVEGGWDVAQCVQLATWLAESGVDLVDASSGGNVQAQIPVGPGYQIPFARQIRAEAGIPTGAVGLITTADQAEQILAEGSADVISIGRQALIEPSWPLRASAELGVAVTDAPYQPQYRRSTWPVKG